MSAFSFFSMVVTVAALFGLISVRVLRLPASAGSMGLATLSALALAVAGRFNPQLHQFATNLFLQVNFRDLVLHGLLAFLLFAGALHLNLDELRRQKLLITILATLGTLISAGLTASLLFVLLRAFHIPLSFPLCLLFGALISPTDPIAVLEMLHRTNAPASLQTLLGGESLFNDGVGAVLFFTVLDWIDSHEATAAGLPDAHTSILAVAGQHILVQALGGLLLGAALGYIAYYLLRSIDHYSIEVLLTLALATGGYALADALHLSAPLEVVAAGLLANSHGRRHAMSPRTRREVDSFWSLLDEMLNVILFLLLGFALLLVPISPRLLLAGVLAIPVVLLSRNLSLFLLVPLHRHERRTHRAACAQARTDGDPEPELVPLRSQWLVLGWGGLRGALSLALVLSLVNHRGSRPLLAITYTVVAFSVLAQGLTMPRLLRRLGLARHPSSHPPAPQSQTEVSATA